MGKIILLLLSSLAFTFGQTDFRDFISPPGKFASRDSNLNPSSSFSSRSLSRPAGRRNLFFPPPDRLSPTVRPILPPPQQEAIVTSPRATTALSRFHPPVESQSFSASKKEKVDEYEDVYYEYYQDYIYGEENTTTEGVDDFTTTSSTTSKFKPSLAKTTTERTIVSEDLASTKKESKPRSTATAFSKFHSGTFRFNSPPKETSRQNETPIKGFLTTKAPAYRFRFSTSEKSARPILPSIRKSNSSKRKGLLADLLAQRNKKDDDPSMNDVDSQRQERVSSDSTTVVEPETSTVSEPNLSIRYRFSNSSGKTFSVSSFSSSSREVALGRTTTITSDSLDDIFETSTLPAEDFTEYASTEREIGTEKSSGSSRSEGKRLFDENSAKENTVLRVEGPPVSKHFSPQFENIQIVVNPSLLPPGYAVEENLTNIVIDEVPSVTSPATVYETTALNNLSSDDVTNSDNNSNNESTLRPFETTTGSLADDEEAVVNTVFNSSEKGRQQSNNLKLSSNKGFLNSESKKENILSTLITNADVSSFLPPGFKPKDKKEETTPPVIGGLPISTVDVSKFLPKGFKPSKETEKEFPASVVTKVDPSSFLPPGFQPNDEENDLSSGDSDSKTLLPVVKSVDISNFLPPGFAKKNDAITTEAPGQTTRRGKLGIVFPRRPNRPTVSTTKKPRPSGPPPLKPKIQNLFERVKGLGTTDYEPPIITEDPNSVHGDSPTLSSSSSTSPTSISTTTTTLKPTTTTPPRPTTPGVCGSACRLAASLRLTGGAEWKPELANRDTFEFQILANEIENELDAFYRSGSLSPWFEYVEVDSFHRGSVVVSYILSLGFIEADIDTVDLKQRLNSDLQRVSNYVGNFTVDPQATDFIVIPDRQVLMQEEGDDFLIPEWLIAVIVIGLASFLFILIFGVVALVSRARVRKRANVPLTEEFLNNLNALQVNGIDNYAMNGLYDMDPVWNEKFQEKAMKPPSSRGKGYNPEYNVNIYDSWRTDYSAPYTSSSNAPPKRRPGLEMDGKQFYKDDPYDEF